MLTPWFQLKIQSISSSEGVKTFSQLLIPKKGSGQNLGTQLVGVLTIGFLCVYAAAQLTAGGKALNSLLNWPEISGAGIGALILFLYSFKGGIRASIWTDSIQAIVMFTAMIALCGAGLTDLGGFSNLYSALNNIDPSLTDMAPSGAAAAGLFFFGWIFGGFAACSMPHVAVRFMTVSNKKNTLIAQGTFILTVIGIVFLATTCALLARVYITNLTDPELALPNMALQILPELFVGIVLAGIFASSMSSADSMVLSCSSELSQNLVKKWSGDLENAKLATLLMIVSVLLISIYGSHRVFDLVVFAVGGMGSAFAPILLLRVWGIQPSHRVSVATILGGLITALVWRYGLNLNSVVFEAAPGIVAGFLTYLVFCRLDKTTQNS